MRARHNFPLSLSQKKVSGICRSQIELIFEKWIDLEFNPVIQCFSTSASLSGVDFNS